LGRWRGKLENHKESAIKKINKTNVIILNALSINHSLITKRAFLVLNNNPYSHPSLLLHQQYFFFCIFFIFHKYNQFVNTIMVISFKSHTHFVVSTPNFTLNNSSTSVSTATGLSFTLMLNLWKKKKTSGKWEDSVKVDKRATKLHWMEA